MYACCGEHEQGVRYAFVFGSYARGDDDVRSDIDVFVVGDLQSDDLLRRIQSIETTLDREINPVIWTEDELLARTRERAPFLMTLLAEPKIWLTGDEPSQRVADLGNTARIPKRIASGTIPLRKSNPFRQATVIPSG